jgi:hypothetical protein
MPDDFSFAIAEIRIIGAVHQTTSGKLEILAVLPVESGVATSIFMEQASETRCFIGICHVLAHLLDDEASIDENWRSCPD